MRFLIISAVAASLSTSAVAQTVEFMHHWVSPSERAALDVFADAYRAQGGEWVEDVYSNWDARTRATMERLADGFPPTAMLDIGWASTRDMLNNGLISTLDEVATPEQIAMIHPMALAESMVGDSLAALPISMFVENRAYYSAELMTEMGFEPPTSFDEFFNQMEAIEAAGHGTVTINRGQGEWRRVMENIILDIGGTELTHAITTDQMSDDVLAKIETAFNQFLRFRALVHRSGVLTEGWQEGIDVLLEGRATVLMNGSWVKGELVAAGAVPGVDFLCSAAPGTGDVFHYGMSSIIFPVSRNGIDRELQRRLLAVILDPVNQVEFVRHKGALPAIHTFDITALDSCALQYWRAASADNADDVAPRTGNHNSSRVFGFVTHQIAEGVITTTAEAINTFRKEVQLAVEN